MSALPPQPPTGDQLPAMAAAASSAPHMYESFRPEWFVSYRPRRQYVCGVCGKVCGQKIDLTRHERSHSSEKPFKCSHCQKSFKHKHHLKAHETFSCSTTAQSWADCHHGVAVTGSNWLYVFQCIILTVSTSITGLEMLVLLNDRLQKSGSLPISDWWGTLLMVNRNGRHLDNSFCYLRIMELVAHNQSRITSTFFSNECCVINSCSLSVSSKYSLA